MMRLSANMYRAHEAYGLHGTLDLFAEVGFQGVDFPNHMIEYCTAERGADFYREVGAYAASRGVTICQAHAPYPSSFDGDEERTEARCLEILQAMENAAALGAPMLVVHPCIHREWMSREGLLERNLVFYRRLAVKARELGIRIAIENIPRYLTGTPDGLVELFDALDDPIFTICFDVGHCLLEGVDPAEAIRTIGGRMVDGCTHFHDNDGAHDTHTLPFYGKVEWERVMEALADIGYEGDLSYEASSFIKDLPTVLYPDGLTLMAKVGQYLIGRFEHYKSAKAGL